MNTFVRRALWGAGILVVVAFAVEGGEYGSSDLLRQRARRRALTATIDTLEHQVDSLQKLQQRLESDPVLQERIAREEFGMVRGDRELLYRFADSTTRDRSRGTSSPRP